MAVYRILSLDGGGLRGLITARLLQRLNASEKIAGWLRQADLIAGTSTGGILALGLAAGHAPEAIGDLYRDKGATIFDDNLLDDVRDLGRTVGAEYSNRALKKELRRLFGETTLAQLGQGVVIPTFDLDNGAADRAQRSWKPKIFHNCPGADADGGCRAVDVALYTSAAPTYFPSVDGYIDGGVFANNPSLVAVAQALSRAGAAPAALDEIVLLSVGTGVSPSFVSGRSLDWGYAQWIEPLIHILMDGVSGISDYQCRQLLGARYHRLQVVFGPGERIDLDDVRKIGRMEAIGNAWDLAATVAWLAEHWR